MPGPEWRSGNCRSARAAAAWQRGARSVLCHARRLELGAALNPVDKPPDPSATVASIVKTVRARGYAQRDPNVEPRSSGTIAVPIMAGNRVLATIGMTWFYSAVPRSAVPAMLVAPLQERAMQISRSLLFRWTRP